MGILTANLPRGKDANLSFTNYRSSIFHTMKGERIVNEKVT